MGKSFFIFKHKEFRMKSMKSFMLVMLLAISSSFFAGESEPKFSMQIANENSAKMTLEMMIAVMRIHTCYMFSKLVLDAYDPTHSIKDKGKITVAACTSVYAAFLASAAYQNMSKSVDENQK